MALVKCPECGRENVSDSAEACPNCGFGIKKHFEKIAQEQENEQQKEKMRKLRLEIEEQESKEHQEKIDEIKMPQKPSLSFKLFWGILATAFSIFCVGVGIFSLNSSDPEGSLIAVSFPFICVGSYLIDDSIKSFKKKKKLYQLANNDFGKYQEQFYIEQNMSEMNRQVNNKINGTPRPFCPVCGSTQVIKISTANRIVSVGVLGLASSKIGKQYECLKCKHKW